MGIAANRKLGRPAAYVLVVLAVVASPASVPAAPNMVKGPWLLTALPSMGTVTWRCDAARERRGRPALALGIDASKATATETLELAVDAKRIVRRTIQPGQSLELPYLRQTAQQLVIVQSTKPGILRAVVRVDFSPRPVSPSHCWQHLPPAVTVRVFPR